MPGRDLTTCLQRHHQVVPLAGADADIADEREIKLAIKHAIPEAVVHAAAFTVVDQREGERNLVRLRRYQLRTVVVPPAVPGVHVLPTRFFPPKIFLCFNPGSTRSAGT
jgi:hypothetical protein